MPDDSAMSVSGLDVVAFLGELVLLAALAVAGSRLGEGLVGVGLAIAFPVLLGVAWGLWLAPRAPWRLDRRGRLVAKSALVVAAAALLAVSGLPIWALVVAVTVGPAFVMAELQGHAS